MGSLAKAYLIFPIVLLSAMLLAVPVYAAEDDQQLQEETTQESEESQEEQPGEEEQENIQVVDAEEGTYSLFLLTNTTMRSEPAADSKRIITVPFGIELGSSRKATNTDGEAWYEVTYGGMSGYISADSVKAEVKSAEETAENPVNPGSKKAAVTTQPAKQTVTTKETTASGGGTTDLSMAQNSFSTADVPATGRMNLTFFIFMMAFILALVIALLVFVRLRFEYTRYRKQILKARKSRELQD